MVFNNALFQRIKTVVYRKQLHSCIFILALSKLFSSVFQGQKIVVCSRVQETFNWSGPFIGYFVIAYTINLSNLGILRDWCLSIQVQENYTNKEGKSNLVCFTVIYYLHVFCAKLFFTNITITMFLISMSMRTAAVLTENHISKSIKFKTSKTLNFQFNNYNINGYRLQQTFLHFYTIPTKSTQNARYVHFYRRL